MATKRATRTFAEELPRLLAEREMSLRSVAQSAGVGPDHLSRVVRGARGKRASSDLASRVSVALGLPRDYFMETRLAVIADHLQNDPALLDRVYRQILRAGGSAS